MISPETIEHRTRGSVNLVPVAMSDAWFVELMVIMCRKIMTMANTRSGEVDYVELMGAVHSRMRELVNMYPPDNKKESAS